MINEIRNPDDNGRRLCEAYVVEISIFRPKNARTCTPTCTKTLKVVIFDF